MNKIIQGKAFVLGDNIDTDQIIPAEYLSYNPADPRERKYFGKYAMCGVPAEQSGLPRGNIPFVAPEAEKSPFAVIVAGKNFGCGSSREHAPLAIAEAGCHAVVAESYARIFYRNSINGGYLIPLETPQRLIDDIRTGDQVLIDVAAGTLKHVRGRRAADPTRADANEYRLKPLGDIADIIESGGIFEYARRSGMLK